MAHVLLTPSWYPKDAHDVAGVFFREQAIVLRNAGHRVGVIAPRSLSLRSPRAWMNFAAPPSVELDEGIPTYRSSELELLGRVPWVGPERWLARGLRLFDAYVQSHGEPDLIHAHAVINGGLLAKRIHDRTGIPYVITEHSTAFARRQVATWQLALARKAFRRAAARIAVSQPFAMLLDDLFGSMQGGWRVVPNVVDAGFLTGGLDRRPRSPSGVLFSNVGLMTAKKGHEVLIRAFASAFGTDGSHRLAIGGDGPLRRGLEELAGRLGVGDRVEFRGLLNREEVVGLLRESDVFVLASYFETFGVVVAEALAMGRPVIATASGGPEYIVGERDGVLVRPGDIDSLAGAMRQVAANLAEYPPGDLRKRCSARFSGQAVAGELSAIYAEVLQRSQE